MITREKLLEQHKALVAQRDQAVDILRQAVGGIAVLDYLLAEDSKPEEVAEPVNQPLPFPEVGAHSTIHTEADVPQGSYV